MYYAGNSFSHDEIIIELVIEKLSNDWDNDNEFHNFIINRHQELSSNFNVWNSIKSFELQ